MLPERSNFSRDRARLPSRLAKIINTCDITKYPWIILAGCGEGWTEVAIVDSLGDTNYLSELIPATIKGLVEQHNNECGPDQNVDVVVRGIYPEHQRNPTKVARELFELLNTNTTF